MEKYLLRVVVGVALYVVTTSMAWAQTAVEYIHTDALGTPVAVTNSAGTVIERSVYEPYGQLVNRPLTDGPGFTGHVQDATTGLTYTQQRYYDPQIGRFLSVDPVTAYSSPGANFNRYWYANNNPYKFVDPDGRFGCSPLRNTSGGCNNDPTGRRPGDPGGACDLRPCDNSFAAGDGGKATELHAKGCGTTECDEVKATRAGIMREGGETLKEAGAYGAKEAAMMYGPAKLGKWLGGLARFFRVSDDAARIAGGHAFSKHGKEFASLGIRTERQFARHIDDVMANPTSTRSLERGRTAFWDQRSGTVVIRDPSSADGGTAFIPTRGIDYFNGLR